MDIRGQRTENTEKTGRELFEFTPSQVMEALEQTNIYLFRYFPKLKMCVLAERTAREFRCKSVYYDMPGSFGDEFVHNEDRQSYDDMYREIHAGTQMSSAEFRSKNSLKWCRVTLRTAEWDENRASEMCVGTVEDLSDIKNHEQALQRVLSSISCGVIQHNRDTNEILMVNKAALEILGYSSKEEMLEDQFDGVAGSVVPADREYIHKVIAELKTPDEVRTYEYKAVHKNGDVVFCYGSVQIFYDHMGNCIVQRNVMDVTEKERTAYMLKRERQQYRDAVTANSIFYYDFDVTDGKLYHDVSYSDGTTFGRAFDIEFPIHYDDLVKVWKERKKPELLTPDDHNQNTTKELIRHFEKGDTHISSEYYIPESGRYYRRLTLLSRDDLTGHIMAIVVANDITDVIRENSRKRNELAMINRSLKKQIEITKSFSSLYFASWEINVETGSMTEISVPDWAHTITEKSGGDYRAACRILVEEFTSEEYKKSVEAFLDIDTLQKRMAHREFLMCEYVGIGDRWRSATIIPSQVDGEGKVRNVIYAVRSVDAEKKKELNAKKALREAYDFANRANAAKTDFLASMSHDIRTPMNAIIGMTAIAEAHLDDIERVRDCLSKITVSSNHLLGLINEVLDMNKIESGNLELVMEEICLPELVDNLVTISRPQVEKKHHTLTVSMNGVEHENAIGDSMRIQQVFMNLLSNAIKYTPDGGQIRLTVSEKTTNNNRVGCYEFIIEDNGIGMSEEFLASIYEPFTRARDSQVEKIQGTGLGMSITRNIVRMMNGDIKVESKLGEGSRFTVTIYLRLQKNSDRAKMSAEEETEPFGNHINDFAKKDFAGKRALLVEDNELNAEIAIEILGMTGIEIEHAENGERAVERVRQAEDGYYDIIFMDVQMPVMNGYEATRAIRALPGDYAKTVPIVAMTANAFAEDVLASKSAGMNEHVSKPLVLKQLFTTLNKWL